METGTEPRAEELIALERRWWEAFQAHDGAVAAALCSEPSIVTGAQGVHRLDRAAIASLVEGFDSNLERFELVDPRVHFVDRDVALVTYVVHEEIVLESPRGPERVVVDAADSSTWVRRGGTWLCALHSESLLGDPYGRDRKRGT